MKTAVLILLASAACALGASKDEIYLWTYQSEQNNSLANNFTGQIDRYRYVTATNAFGNPFKMLKPPLDWQEANYLQFKRKVLVDPVAPIAIEFLFTLDPKEGNSPSEDTAAALKI